MNNLEMLRELIIDGAEIITVNYWLNAVSEFRHKVLEECGHVA